MANRQRSRNLGAGEGARTADTIGHVTPESKPLINPEAAGGTSPKQVAVILGPGGAVSPNSVDVGPQS